MGFRKLLMVVALLCASAFAQNVLVPVPPIFVGPGTTPRLGANLTITFCTSTATGAPCSPLAQAYADSTNSNPINQSINPLKTDALGNAPAFYAAPGQYSFTVTGPGIGTPQGPYQIAVSIVPSANIAFTGNNTHSGTETFASATITGAVTAGSVQSVCLVDGANTHVWAGTDVLGWLNSAMAACNEIYVAGGLGTLNASTQMVVPNKSLRINFGAGTTINWTGGATDMVVINSVTSPINLIGPARLGPTYVATPPAGFRLLNAVAGSNTIHITNSAGIHIEGMDFDGGASLTDAHILLDVGANPAVTDRINIMGNLFLGKLNAVGSTGTGGALFQINIGGQYGSNLMYAQGGDAISLNAATTGNVSIYIENNWIRSSTGNGINIFGAQGTTDLKIRNNQVSNITATNSAGIVVSTGNGVEITGNDIESITGGSATSLAIYLTSTTGAVVYGNTIFDVRPSLASANGPINLNTVTNSWILPNRIQKGSAPGSIAISANAAASLSVTEQWTDFATTYARLGAAVQLPFFSQIWTTTITGVEGAAPSAFGGVDTLYPGSPGHRWAMNNNNTGPTNVAGFSDYTVTLKKGSGAGNYTSATTTYAVVDSTNLCYTVTIPTGFKLSVVAQGETGTNTAVVLANVALTDNASCSTANAGILIESAVTAPSAGVQSPFTLAWVINGDGASHNIAMQFKTANAADSTVLANVSSTLLPTMVFTLMPSN